MLSEALICPDSQPTFLNFFDLSVAPTLLFYAYIPIILVSLFFGILVFAKNKKALLGKLLLALSVVFSLWIIDLIIQWVSVYVSFDYFFWQTTPLLEVSIPLVAVYFVYVFVNEHDMPFWHKILLSIPYIAMCLFIPTHYNVLSFDLLNCQGNFGNFYDYVYAFEVATAFLVGYISFKKLRDKKIPSTRKKQILLLGISSVLFLLIFAITNIFGEITKIYEINLFGPIGMILFLGLLTFMIVKYHAFNMKIIGAQALVISLTILIGSQFFFIQTNTNRILTAITLILIGFIGLNLIRSVKKEVRQREEIEKLAGDLEVANEKLKELDQLKSEFLSLATHQIRAPLTAIKGYSSMLLDGDFGILPQKAKDSVETIMKSCQNLINIVGDFLNISRIEQGRMVYEKSVFDIGELVKEVLNEIKPSIEKAGLSLDINVPDKEIEINADRDKIKQVIGNVVDNAIKYTLRGGINVSVFREKGLPAGRRVKIAIKDSGVGIDPNDIGKLFAKFSRTKDANKTNITGTGLGLYIAKKMTEAHKGDIKIESEGRGKGSTFTIELPEADAR